MNRIAIEDAKARIRIPDLWTRYNLPGTPAKSCRCPFHDDGKNSFSITPDGLLWHCFAGCGGGDAVDFLARLRGLDKGAACLALREMATGYTGTALRSATQSRGTDRADKRATWPRLESPTRAELDALARLRSIPRDSLEWAAARGVLRMADWHGQRAWIVSDATATNAQARRLDGLPWAEIDAKAWTLPGSRAAWSLGIREAQPYPAILLCEGGPDFLAAHWLILSEQATDARVPERWSGEVRCAPVAMLGAGNFIPPDALPHFSTKRVRIAAHADEAGNEAAEKWAKQLASAGADVDALNLDGLTRTDGQRVKDLNDLLLADARSWREFPDFKLCPQ